MAGLADGSGSPNGGPLANVVIPNTPAPERGFPERTGDSGYTLADVAPLESGIQPKTEDNELGQLPPTRLIGLT